MGIAIIEGSASHPVLLMSDCVQPPKGTPESRLAYIARASADAIAAFQPEALALETLFFNRNRKTALGVAEARGAILAAAGRAALPVIECSPQQVKCAITGYGNADKTAVATMVQRMLSLPPKKRLDDELDAIAIGIAALALGS